MRKTQAKMKADLKPILVGAKIIRNDLNSVIECSKLMAMVRCELRTGGRVAFLRKFIIYFARHDQVDRLTWSNAVPCDTKDKGERLIQRSHSNGPTKLVKKVSGGRDRGNKSAS